MAYGWYKWVIRAIMFVALAVWGGRMFLSHAAFVAPTRAETPEPQRRQADRRELS